jgi:4a-hydroxytetrahydrobiopterin dehydratase
MSERISPARFHEADGVEDWRVVGDGVCAYFRTASFADGARLVQAIGGLAGRDDSPEDLVDPYRRGLSLWFQGMDAPRPQRNRLHVDVWVPHDRAEERVAAALAAGGRLVSDAQAPAWWVLADPEGNEVCVATWRARD